MAGKHFKASGPSPSKAPVSRARRQAPTTSIPYGINSTGANPYTSSSNTNAPRPHKGKRIALIVVGVLLALIVVCGVSGFMLYSSAQRVMADAQIVMDTGSGMTERLKQGDSQGLAQDAQTIADAAGRMNDEVSSPLWTVASFMPVVGGDVRAAVELVGVLDDVSSGAIVPITNDLASADIGKLIDNGAINVNAISTLATSVSNASPVIEQACIDVEAIGPTNIPQVTELVNTAKTACSSIDTGIDAFNKIAPYLPQMLGANGQTRNYLLMAENNVELRATGGGPGSWGVLSVTDGKMSLGQFVSSGTLPNGETLPISTEEDTLFKAGTSSHFGSVSIDSFMTPDFVRAAQMSRDIWASTYGNGQQVDGVIAIDPVFLQSVLALTGGTTLPDGTQVNGDNAAQVLMHDVYWNYPVDQQDAIFSAVASSAFSQVFGDIGGADITGLLTAMQEGIEQGRVLIWFANPDEEAVAESLGASGELPTDPAIPVAGIYLNNYSYSKIDWYLDMQTQVGQPVDNSDGSRSYQITVTLSNTMTAEEEATAPQYVSGYATAKRSVGDMVFRLYLYAPAGGSISDQSISGGDLSLQDASHNGLQVSFGQLRLLPGETCTVTYTVTTSPEAAGADLALRVTPTAQNNGSNGASPVATTA